mgnify:FL=1
MNRWYETKFQVQQDLLLNHLFEAKTECLQRDFF